MKLNRLAYLGIASIYFAIVLFLVTIAAGAGLADNATVDTGELTDAITAAEGKAEDAIVGTDIGQYPRSAIDVFNKAIAAAQKVADDRTATQDEIDDAVTDLKAAGKQFDAAKIATVSKTELTTAVSIAKAKAGDAVAGTDTGQYPRSAIDAFNAAIATAQKVAVDDSATVEEVNEAVSELKAAEKKFDEAKIAEADGPAPISVSNLRETGAGPDWISWEWVNPDDADLGHVMVYIDGVFAANVPASSSSYNATGLAEGTTYTIGICTADISGNIGTTWVNDSAATVKLPGIYNVSGTDITTGSLTLVWGASDDTTLVRILRDDVMLTNVSGTTSFTDGGLDGDTSYIYTLIPCNEAGIEGKAVVVKMKTASSKSSGGSDGGSSSSSKKSSSSGGGGGGSSEDFANIALKDADSAYLRANANVTYEFTKPGNDILSIGFYSLKNSGDITATVEMLNNRSRLSNSSPEGLVYEYINIWVGKSGFATQDNIRDAQVMFRVNSSWLEAMGVVPADVQLQRYNGTEWEMLPVTLVSSTGDYAVFKSQVPGFSPFAITAERALATPADVKTEAEPEAIEAVGTGQVQTRPARSGIWTFVKGLVAVEVLAVAYEYRRRKKQ